MERMKIYIGFCFLPICFLFERMYLLLSAFENKHNGERMVKMIKYASKFTETSNEKES